MGDKTTAEQAFTVTLEQLLAHKVAELAHVEAQQDQAAQLARALNALHLQVADEIDALRRTIAGFTTGPSAADLGAVVAEQGALADIPTTSRAPRPKKAAKASRAGTSRYDFDEVAAIAREARDAGQAMTRAVAAHFRIADTAAGQLISRARVAGRDIPTGQLRGARPTIPPREPTGRVVVRCEEPGCDETFSREQLSKLYAHTRDEHGRRPTTSERAPRDEADLAA